MTNPTARSALPLWDIPLDATLSLINVAENETYLVEAPDYKAILRLHRIGYHSKRAIESELAWSSALARDTGIETPSAIAGRNAALVQTVTPNGLPSQHAVLFEFIEGAHPDESQDLATAFHNLGLIAAQTHLHSITWQRPKPFERLTWDRDAVFGETPTWSDWRDAPNVTTDLRRILERAQRTVTHRLTAYGQDAGRYGLIHADMRLANLLLLGDNTCLIDFDDCGFGWFMYDFAAAISFIEDSSQIPALRTAWLAGYRSIRTLTAEDEQIIDTLIILRRMALLAWIGSHMEATEPQALAPDFAKVTAQLATKYLAVT
ncbi:MAG: phosphotransferase [Paracoccaceae bacterium]|jgi:Ser/Thr protein kinase RdoA (MazF antagonist)